MEQLNTIGFEEIIENDEEDCLVIFSRKSCHVCQSVHKILLALEKEFSYLPFYDIDVEAEPELMHKFNLKGVPHVMLFSNGKLLRKLSGKHDIDEYANALEQEFPK